jgi:hypothetical protein
MIKKYLKKLFDILERPWPYFFTFHLRPKRAKRIGIAFDELKDYPKMAIVVQGPIIYDQDFTFETLKLYKKYFPQTVIILSTWDYERKDCVDKIDNEGVKIILNKVPVIKGVGNINFQIVSSVSGIKKARELGAEYILKTRTDQRIYNPNSLEFLVNAIEKFLPSGGLRQNRRIIGVSLNSFKYRMYGLSDMNLFGNIEDMLKYWNVELDDNGKGFVDLKIGVSELYLSTKFLKGIGREIKWTLEDSWQAFADNFCVVDASSLDLYWYKYSRMKEYKYLKYAEMKNDQEISFLEWFNIYCNLQNKHIVDSDKIKKVIP